MTSRVSFGSMFNPEIKINKKSVKSGSTTPENNIESSNANQQPKSPFLEAQAVLGKSQIKSPKDSPAMPFTDKEIAYLDSLSSYIYGFHGNSNDFWVHAKEYKEDGQISNIMGDGRIKDGKSRKDYVLELIDNNVKAFNVAGESNKGSNVSATFIKDEKSNKTTIYLQENNKVTKLLIDSNDMDKLKASIAAVINRTELIHGATVWK